jgi:hypothetical protein
MSVRRRSEVVIHTVVRVGRETGGSRKIEYSSLLNVRAGVSTIGYDGNDMVVAGGGGGGGEGSTGASLLVCCCCCCC